MIAETKVTAEILTDENRRALQELIEVNIDSYRGFTQAADEALAGSLAKQFFEFASQRLALASELQWLLRSTDREPLTEASVTGRIHRSIMDWRSVFSDGETAVLKEAERGEDYIKAKYEAVLAQTAGTGVTELLGRHYAAVKNVHNTVRELRDRLAR